MQAHVTGVILISTGLTLLLSPLVSQNRGVVGNSGESGKSSNALSISALILAFAAAYVSMRHGANNLSNVTSVADYARALLSPLPEVNSVLFLLSHLINVIRMGVSMCMCMHVYVYICIFMCMCA